VSPVPQLPSQDTGTKPSRALPYELSASCTITPNTVTLGATQVQLSFGNTGMQAAVFHVYDRLNLTAIPRRFTVEPGKQLSDKWVPATSGSYDLWVLGPNGFHRHFTGNARRVAAAAQPNPDVVVSYDKVGKTLSVKLSNGGTVAANFSVVANAYYPATPTAYPVAARSETVVTLPIAASGGWYDFSVKVNGQADYSRRFAGRMETGADSVSDPAMHGTAVGDQYHVG
jgi:phospholipase C